MNRWKYDPERLIPITCMNPQQARKYDKQVQKTEGTTTQEFYTDSYGAAYGARVTDDTGALRSIRNMGESKNADSPSTSAPDVTGVKTGGGQIRKRKVILLRKQQSPSGPESHVMHLPRRLNIPPTPEEFCGYV